MRTTDERRGQEVAGERLELFTDGYQPDRAKLQFEVMISHLQLFTMNNYLEMDRSRNKAKKQFLIQDTKDCNSS